MTATPNIPTSAMLRRVMPSTTIDISFLMDLLVGHWVGGNEVLTISRDGRYRYLCVDAPVLQLSQNQRVIKFVTQHGHGWIFGHVYFPMERDDIHVMEVSPSRS